MSSRSERLQREVEALQRIGERGRRLSPFVVYDEVVPEGASAGVARVREAEQLTEISVARVGSTPRSSSFRNLLEAVTRFPLAVSGTVGRVLRSHAEQIERAAVGIRRDVDALDSFAYAIAGALLPQRVFEHAECPVDGSHVRPIIVPNIVTGRYRCQCCSFEWTLDEVASARSLETLGITRSTITVIPPSFFSRRIEGEFGANAHPGQRMRLDPDGRFVPAVDGDEVVGVAIATQAPGSRGWVQTEPRPGHVNAGYAMPTFNAQPEAPAAADPPVAPLADWLQEPIPRGAPHAVDRGPRNSPGRRPSLLERYADVAQPAHASDADRVVSAIDAVLSDVAGDLEEETES